MKILEHPLIFEWDIGNNSKNFIKHAVNNQECEETFFDPNKRIVKDTWHSGKEDRYIVIGATKKHRVLYIVFTKRVNKVRIISARDLNRKERYLYEEKN